MTVVYLVFAGITTVYILVAIHLEEQGLIKVYGKAYVDYRDRVPTLIPSSRHNVSLK
ncbi:MAG: hypothetical protein Kow00121_35670 [Elainellaceae cyanobacterium]